MQANVSTAQGQPVYAIPYDYIYACQEAPEVCLGSPYFNWGVSYVSHISRAILGEWESVFEWLSPDWSDINNPETSHVGFVMGDAVTEENEEILNAFIQELADGLNLWTGPLYFQDGTVFLAEGQVATDVEIWYLPQLLLGTEGRSE